MIDRNGEYINAKVRMAWVQEAVCAATNWLPEVSDRVREGLRSRGLPDDERAVRRWLRAAFWECEDRKLIDFLTGIDDWAADRLVFADLRRKAAAVGVFLQSAPGASA